MTFLPVIVRELRAEARRTFNYWLRVVGAGAMAFVVVSILINPRIRPSDLGQRLFSGLNATLFIAIWVLAPLMTADCLSRERREGTLGLVFLTRLKPFGIVLGKSLIHGWRAMTLFLALLPLLTLPFLMGGVSGKDVAMALILDSSALMLALAAGLLASAWSKDGVRVLMAAELLSLVFALAFMSCHYFFYMVLDAHIGFSFGRFKPFFQTQTPLRVAWQLYHQVPFVPM